MRRIGVVLLLFLILPISAASADWRWKTPKLKVKRVTPVCDLRICHIVAKIQTKENHKAKVKHYNTLKLNEWKMWTSIPDTRLHVVWGKRVWS
jgi:hypothetical protein